MAKRSEFQFSENLGGAGQTDGDAAREVTGASSLGDEARRVVGEAGQDASNATGTAEGTGAGTGTGDAPVKKKRGRQPYPRDENGQIIRPAGATSGKSSQSKGPGLAVDFKPNNREAVLQNIQGMHAMAAALTKQPIMLLSPPEAKAMTDALCNVLDYHRINITDATGPWGLYVALAVTGYGIYWPRLKALKRGSVQIEQPTAPATAEEAAFNAMMGAGGMDFSGDLSEADLNGAQQH